MSQQTKPKFTNRLIQETSPYLLQHAHNPVDWYPWGEEALSKSREETKPILLSIGYSACHWCHVMERESFENEEIAKIMNEHFICIKVDREERPDLDEIYMSATVAMNNGQGGWPMTVFLTPEQEPFFTGTYFPPENRYGRPGFGFVLSKIAELWENDREGLIRQGKSLAEHLHQLTVSAPPQAIGTREIDQAATHLAREFDPSHGGFGRAPKFPPSTALSLLLRSYQRTNDSFSLEMVNTTLHSMGKGGMYDQIGGGFARYSTDERWLVPHFEKMLYDNALLVKIYLEGFQVTQDKFYQKIASETLDYIVREMTSPEGGFYSSTDADSEGEEGKFFVWTPGEIKAALGGDEALYFCAYYDITEEGNWEGKNIPNIPRSMEQVAKQLSVAPETLKASLKKSREKIYQARLKRISPGLDDKILTSWNGLMIGAMAEGARVLGEPRYLKSAEKAADFILTHLKTKDRRLLRTYRAGKAHLNACLDDYAYLCEGLIDLYEAGGNARYLEEAAALADTMMRDFSGSDGTGFYNTSRKHEKLIIRPREGHDGATPNPNATAAYCLARLSYHLDREDMRKIARSAVLSYGKAIERIPRAFCKALATADLLLGGPIEMALVGDPKKKETQELLKEVNQYYLPNRTLAHSDPSGEQSTPDLKLPLMEGKKLVNGKSALYVCYHFACQAPITESHRVKPALEAQYKTLIENRQQAL